MGGGNHFVGYSYAYNVVNNFDCLKVRYQMGSKKIALFNEKNGNTK